MTRIRTAHQIFFLMLFVIFLLIADLAWLGGFPVSLFLELDPLVALATALATHSVYKLLGLSLIVVVLTVLVGRAWCNWVCPFGTLHHVVGWLGFRRRGQSHMERVNRYRPLYALKYYILAAMLATASAAALLPRNVWLGQTLTDGASQQIGWLDPVALLTRSMATSVLPAVDEIVPGAVFPVPREFHLGWVVGTVFIALVLANLAIPRLFCRVLCPLGALLGVLARLGLWRIKRDANTCVACGKCAAVCEGAADPDREVRLAECVVCMKCVEVCPTRSIAFAPLAGAVDAVPNPDVRGRRLAIAGVLGLVFYPLTRTSGAVRKLFGPKVIRPPGTVREEEFLKRCIKCGECVRSCPTNILQLALLETGIEGIWSPIMAPRLGYCKLDCVRCSQVCPTGAIREITVDEKRGHSAFAARGPIRIGTAFIRRGRCLPWAMATDCRVCEEVCPVSPKAIYSQPSIATAANGRNVSLRRPYVAPHRCIGCGACEHACPVKDAPAVHVTPIGETRDPARGLLGGMC